MPAYSSARRATAPRPGGSATPRPACDDPRTTVRRGPPRFYYMPQVGDIAPDFELEGTDGKFKLSDQRGKRVVLLFYPGDFTPVCTKQFCSYAERPDDMATLDAVVVGISAQPVERHREFQEMNSIPVPLLADVDRSVAKAYGVSQPLLG